MISLWEEHYKREDKWEESQNDDLKNSSVVVETGFPYLLLFYILVRSCNDSHHTPGDVESDMKLYFYRNCARVDRVRVDRVQLVREMVLCSSALPVVDHLSTRRLSH